MSVEENIRLQGIAPNVSLSNENARMVNAFRQSAFENLSLQPSLQEILNLQSQYVIKAHSCFIEHTDANKSTDEGVTFKQTFWVFCVKLEKLTRSTTNF